MITRGVGIKFSCVMATAGRNRKNRAAALDKSARPLAGGVGRNVTMRHSEAAAVGLSMCAGDQSVADTQNFSGVASPPQRSVARAEKELATPAGFEPATYRLEGGCSIRLSYGVPRAEARGL